MSMSKRGRLSLATDFGLADTDTPDLQEIFDARFSQTDSWLLSESMRGMDISEGYKNTTLN